MKRERERAFYCRLSNGPICDLSTICLSCNVLQLHCSFMCQDKGFLAVRFFFFDRDHSTPFSHLDTFALSHTLAHSLIPFTPACFLFPNQPLPLLCISSLHPSVCSLCKIRPLFHCSHRHRFFVPSFSSDLSPSLPFPPIDPTLVHRLHRFISK